MHGYETLLNSHEYEQEQRYSNRPDCDCCGYRIDTEYAIRVNHKWYCDDCVKRYLRKAVDDYAKD